MRAKGSLFRRLFDCATDKIICSGHDIIFKTDDPNAYRLPSKKILSGAAIDVPPSWGQSVFPLIEEKFLLGKSQTFCGNLP
jgi:hypothetical protein